VDNLWVLGDTMMTIARNPVDIYGLVAQRFFLYVLPIALLGTVPARQLTRGATVHDLTLSLAWALALFGITPLLAARVAGVFERQQLAAEANQRLATRPLAERAAARKRLDTQE
jgi:ABC-type uncharacterized transport system permease subunit